MTLLPDSQILTALLRRLRPVKGPDSRGEYICWCPFHPDGEGAPPHKPNLQVSARGFVCFACGEKGGLRELAEQVGVSLPSNLAPLENAYDYNDEDGNLLFQVVRKPGKKFRQRRPDGNGGWIWNVKGVRRVLYRLPELLARGNEPVLVPEGEKDVDRLLREELLATTNPGGAGKWRDEFSQELAGRDVIILPDNDSPGRSHAQKVAHSLHGVAKSVKVVELPGLPEKGDVSEWLVSGHTVDDLILTVTDAPIWSPDSGPSESENLDSASEARRSQANRIVELVLQGDVELFHDHLGEGFARIRVQDHYGTWRCKGRDFRRWIAREFWAAEKTAVKSDTLTAALNVLEAQARFDGQEHKLWNRVARLDDAIWYDLADDRWRAIRVTPDGWALVQNPPILFRRYCHQRPQVLPVPGSKLASIGKFVNLRDPAQFLLFQTYLVASIVPDIPHPIPVLHGPQGSAKTTHFRILRRLIDPSATETLTLPRDIKALVQQLSHQWAPFYDNVTQIPVAVSDALCRCVTGDGFSKRELYTDDEDVIYEFRRCVGLNGINVVAQRADLLDRCLLFGLEPIGPKERRSEEELWTVFEAARAGLLGATFDALAKAMAIKPTVELPGRPRMADFAEWGCAISEALGHSQQEFLDAYGDNTRSRNEEALASSAIGEMLLAFMEDRASWEGSPTDLLQQLTSVAEQRHVNTKSRSWPKRAHALTHRINEIRPNLAAVGIEVTRGRDGQQRWIQLVRDSGNSVTSVTSVTASAKPDASGDFENDACDAPGDAASPAASSPNPAPDRPMTPSDADDASFLFPMERFNDDP